MPRKKTLLTGRYPTSEDMAKIFGISMARVRRIEEDANRIMAEHDAEMARKRETRRRQAGRRKRTEAIR